MFDDEKSKAIFEKYNPDVDFQTMPVIYDVTPQENSMTEFAEFMDMLLDEVLESINEIVDMDNDEYENAFVAVISTDMDDIGVFDVVESKRICDHLDCFVYAMEQYIKDTHSDLLDTYDGIESVVELTTDRQGNSVMVGSFRLVDLFDLH